MKKFNGIQAIFEIGLVVCVHFLVMGRGRGTGWWRSVILKVMLGLGVLQQTFFFAVEILFYFAHLSHHHHHLFSYNRLQHHIAGGL